MADRSVTVRLRAITSDFDRRLSESAIVTSRFRRELEAADGRMANMVQSTLALAPALVPIGAAGIPAVAGLAAQLGFAALGTGALVLGLHGIGDTLDALNKFQLEPTEDHLKKLREQLSKLGPAGGEFVLFLDHLEPRFRRLQALAEQGLLPGVEDSITHVLNLMPQLRQLVFGVSSTVGDLIRDAGDNLDDPRWQQFFGFLQTRARPTLTEMGQTAGNFAVSFANLVEAFDPLERDFSKGLLHMSQQVREWSDGLEHDQGFQELVDYVRTNGPRALDTLGALGEALLQIVQAAAPVGSVALPILTDLLKIVGAVADTPLIGSGLVALAAAIGVYGRSLALLKTVGLRGDQGVLASTFKGAKTSIGEATTALTTVTTAQDRARLSATQLQEAEDRRSASIRGGLATISKGAALAAGFAVAQTGVADSLGVTNSAAGALIGTIGGPWGAAIGGAVGFTLDLAHANDDLEAAIKRVNAAAAGGDFSDWRTQLHALFVESQNLNKEAANPRSSIFTGHPIDATKDAIRSLKALLGANPAADSKKALQDQGELFSRVRQNAVELFAAIRGDGPEALNPSDDQLTAFITRISPALQRANIDIEDLLAHKHGWLEAQFAVRDWVLEMDSARGKSQAVGDALAELDSQITPTVDAAKQLSDALDALFGTELSQAEATDRWIQGLIDLRKALKEGSNALEGNTEDALKHRAAIRSSVQDLLDRVKADAAAGKSAKAVARELRDGRQAIIDQAVAAGLSEPQVRAYLRNIGLSAKNVNTILDQTTTKLHGIGQGLRNLRDKTVKIRLQEIYDRPGGPTSARGNIFYYAAGDVANRHMPELAGPGPTRIWREPETKGEAYIPLANDWRRPRAVDIWEKTGIALGVQFRRYAFGGMNGFGGGATLSLTDQDVSRIAGALLAARPLIGHQTVMPHNYSEFRRQQDQNERLSSIGGL